MQLYDLIHAYQPYDPDNLQFEWVEKNLKDVFLPTSKAMKNNNIKRGVQIRGWTIDNWLNSENKIQKLARETIDNLKVSINNKNLEVGISGYSHPILPLLNKALIIAQIQLDYEAVRNNLGEPTWFWPPEGAVSEIVLSTIYEKFPELIIVIPDKSLGMSNYSGLAQIKHNDNSYQKVLICNTLLKDLVMNVSCYPRRPDYFPEHLDWDILKELHFDSTKFTYALKATGGNLHVLARDWENKGSQDGLLKMQNGGLDLKSMLETDALFLTPSETKWQDTEIIDLSDIKDATWEIDAPHNDPFMYWWPDNQGVHWNSLNDNQKSWAIKWQQFLNNFNEKFSQWVNQHGGIDNMLDDVNKKEEIKSLLPALMSCIPWHFLVKQMWEPDPGFSEQAWEKIVIPRIKKLDLLLEE